LIIFVSNYLGVQFGTYLRRGGEGAYDAIGTANVLLSVRRIDRMSIDRFNPSMQQTGKNFFSSAAPIGKTDGSLGELLR